MDLYEPGLAVRRAVLGDAYVDRALARADSFTEDFQRFITRYAWGEIWGRDGLDRRTRSCITLALLAAGGHEAELALHVQGGAAQRVDPGRDQGGAPAGRGLRRRAGGELRVRGGSAYASRTGGTCGRSVGG
jgi:hypothetical protein